MWQSVSTLIIAAVALFISWQQKRIADLRLRHDMYDRQFRVYAAAKTLLINFQFDGEISQENYFKYASGIADAEFIFDKDVTEYLGTLREQAVELIRLQKQGAPAADKCAQLENWFMEQFHVLASKFRLALRLRPPSVAERLEWWFRLWSGRRVRRRGVRKS